MDFNDYVKRVEKAHPKTVEGTYNATFNYYYDKLMKMIYTIFKFDNVPQEWNMPYFKEKLYNNGVLAVVDTSAGILPLECNTSGVNVWGQCTDFTISNVVLGNLQGKIGVDGELIYFGMRQNMYQTMKPLVTRYAELLANIDGSLNTTLMNSRVAQVFEAGSNAQMKTMEKVYDQISSGKPAVFIRKTGEDTFDHALFNNVKNTYIGNDLLITKQTIFNEFKSEIGINNSNTQKRERLISSEVESNNAELNSNIYEWFDNLTESINKVNTMFNLGVTVSFNEDVVHLNDDIEDDIQEGDE